MSMHDAMRIAMYDRLLSGFQQAYGSSVPVGTENGKFEEPKDTPYMEMYFRYGKAGRASIGTTAKFSRHNGFFMVDCIVPEKTGTSTAWKMADAVSKTFEAENFTLDDGSAVTLFVPQLVPSGKTQDGRYIITVMIPFLIDTIPLRPRLPSR